MGAVRGEIGARKRSRIHGIVLHGGDDFVRDPSPVEGVRAVAGDGPHRLGIGAIDQCFARAFRAPVRVKEVGSGGREARKAEVLLDHMRKPRRNAEATLGDCRSGLEEPCPRHAAMGAVRTFKHPDDAWHSDRKAADRDRLPRARRTVRIQKKPFIGGGRCSLAPVIGLYDPSRRIVVEQKAAAADAGGLRLDEAQHHLRAIAASMAPPPASRMRAPASAAAG